MSDRSCAQQGHCWHVEDGQPYQRHSGQTTGMVPVICCWCGTPHEAPTGATATAPGHSDPRIPHGTFLLTKELKRVTIVACPACSELNPKIRSVVSKDGQDIVTWLPAPAPYPIRCDKHNAASEVVNV